MSEMIKDGTGNGYLAKVDDHYRLYTYTVSLSEQDDATHEGRSFNVNTGIVTLTNAAETPMLYLKNNETEDLHITAIAVGFGASTGGTGDPCLITMERNPTGGTIVSGATAVDVKTNRNFGSNSTLTADAYKGATGLTMTGGTDHAYFYQSPSGRLYAGLSEQLPKGTSIGITITPQSSNTSMACYVALICHLED